MQSMGVRAAGVGMVAAALCPMHGPVVRSSVTELVGQYRRASLFILLSASVHPLKALGF